MTTKLNFSLALKGLLIIVLLIFVYSFREEIVSNEAKKNPKVIIFGDSLIYLGNWEELLGRKDLLKQGFSGFTTSHFIWFLQKKVIKHEPQVCVLIGGINDISVGIPLARTRQNYRQILDTLLVHNIQPIVNSTLYQQNNMQSKVMVDSLNEFLKDYCKQKSIVYIDINSKLSTEKGLKAENTTDGTHLTLSAYVVWANEIKKVLIK